MTRPVVCYLGHADCWDSHTAERMADVSTLEDAAEPERDACYGQTVRVDESWADELPPCVLCHEGVPWDQALLMPLAAHEDEPEITAAGVIHANGCPKD